MKTYEQIYNIVKKIPHGKVATYGQIGQLLDFDPRVVGWALNNLAKGRDGVSAAHGEPRLWRARRQKKEIPWQRVINSKGTISTNKLMNIPLGLQKKLLEREGVKFDKSEKVDLKKYLWNLK